MAKVDIRTIRAVRPNLGTAARYRACMDKYVKAMHESVLYWLKSAYRQNEPVLAMDAKKPPVKLPKKDASRERRKVANKGLPANELQTAVRRLGRRWQRNMNKGAPALAEYFAGSIEERNKNELKQILKDAGISVERFAMTPAMRDVIAASVHANVALLKSIPAKYFGNVEQLVMQSVTAGRDLSYLTKQLHKNYGVTRRRAETIARDQNNKVTAAVTRARQDELGITKARWKHSHARKSPRKSHLAADGKLYDIKKGMYLDGKWTFPGYEINCGCTSEAVIPGFD